MVWKVIPTHPSVHIHKKYWPYLLTSSPERHVHRNNLFWIGAPRKDKYNKKLKKYYVEHEEDDESGVEDN